MPVNWNQCSIVDGWTVQRASNGHTLTAQIYAAERAVLPTRGDRLPASGPCAVPLGGTVSYESYVVSEVKVSPLSGAGPYLADVTARASLNSGSNLVYSSGDTLLNENTLSAGFSDFIIDETTAPQFLVSDGSSLKSEVTWRFLQVEVSYYIKAGTKGLRSWGKAAGVISDFPDWLKLPPGTRRWRIWDERLEQTTDNDGRTRLWRVSRILLGIPDDLRDTRGTRLQWNPDGIGSRTWNDLI